MSRRNILIAGVVALGVLMAGIWWYGLRPAPSATVDSPAARPTPAVATSGVLAVGRDRAAAMDIRTAPATAATEVPLAAIPAVIQPPANASVAVAATFPGVVVRTMAVEGDRVRQGQSLAVISSREVLTMGADLKRANVRLQVAETGARRLSQLSREGVIAGARADEANALAAEARTDVAEKARILHMVNGDGAQGSYTLRAPISGRVTSAAIKAGHPVDGTTAPFVIDAADRYEVLGQLPERLIGDIRPGMAIRLGHDIIGRIVAVGATIDPATRSASLKAQIPAGPGIVTGSATTVEIMGAAPAGAVSLPVEAVTMIDGQPVVFVPATGGYAMRKVATGGSSDGRMVLLSGVTAGEQVVVSGTSALKALVTMQ